MLVHQRVIYNIYIYIYDPPVNYNIDPGIFGGLENDVQLKIGYSHLSSGSMLTYRGVYIRTYIYIYIIYTYK